MTTHIHNYTPHRPGTTPPVEIERVWDMNPHDPFDKVALTVGDETVDLSTWEVAQLISELRETVTQPSPENYPRAV